jgi:MFS family permease
VFLVAFIREFGWSRSVVAGAFSVLVLGHGVSGPVLVWLVERFGPRAVIATGGAVLAVSIALGAHITAVWHLYVVFGVLASLGVSAAGWVPAVVLIRGWFPHRVGTAIGIASAGIGVGIFALVPFTQLLIDSVGWRWALRVLACESGGNPYAVGSQGERGLMQLHPVHAAKFLARGWTWDDAFVPERNLAVAHDIYLAEGWTPWSWRWAAAA